jgi:hypothetical protein
VIPNVNTLAVVVEITLLLILFTVPTNCVGIDVSTNALPAA